MLECGLLKLSKTPWRARKLATVYRYRGALYVRASSRTSAGVWVDSGPVIRLSESADDQEIANALFEALGRSRDPVPHPARSEFAQLARPLLECAGARTWTQFEKSAACVEVAEDERGRRQVTLMTRGPQGGYLPQPPVDTGADSASVVDALRSLLSLDSR